MGPAIPVGGGGAGAKAPPPAGYGQGQKQRLSDKIGDMVEESRQREGSGSGDAKGGQSEEPMRRADGTVLQPRGDKPKNPKKKMFEADVEDRKHEEAMRQRDEL